MYKLSRVGLSVRLTFISLFMLWVLVPIYWLINTSFKHNSEVISSFSSFWPTHFTWSAYSYVINNLGVYFENSIVVSLGATIFSLIIGLLAAYSLSRFKFSKIFTSFFWFIILAIRMMIPIVFIIPLYQIFQNLGLYNTRVGLIIAYTLVNLPFVIWMMVSFFNDVPVELEEAAMVDGASRLRAFIRIILPLGAPGIAAVSILTIVMTWNDLIFGLYLTSNTQAMTLPVGIVGFITQYKTLWAQMAAAGTLAIVPMIFVVLFVQKYLVRGLTAGAIK